LSADQHGQGARQFAVRLILRSFFDFCALILVALPPTFLKDFFSQFYATLPDDTEFLRKNRKLLTLWALDFKHIRLVILPNVLNLFIKVPKRHDLSIIFPQRRRFSAANGFCFFSAALTTVMLLTAPKQGAFATSDSLAACSAQSAMAVGR
jgi:hypothetical protein